MSSVRDLTPVSIENWPTAISLNWQPPRQTNGQITGMFYFTGMSVVYIVLRDGKAADREYYPRNLVGEEGNQYGILN